MSKRTERPRVTLQLTVDEADAVTTALNYYALARSGDEVDEDEEFAVETANRLIDQLYENVTRIYEAPQRMITPAQEDSHTKENP